MKKMANIVFWKYNGLQYISVASEYIFMKTRKMLCTI